MTQDREAPPCDEDPKRLAAVELALSEVGVNPRGLAERLSLPLKDAYTILDQLEKERILRQHDPLWYHALKQWDGTNWIDITKTLTPLEVRLNLLIQIDKELAELLGPDWQNEDTPTEQSRIEKLLHKLLYYGFRNDDIITILDERLNAEWRNKTPHFKEEQINKSIESLRSQHPLFFLIDNLKIYPGTPNYYEIVIANKPLRVDEDVLLNPTKCRRVFFANFGIQCPPLGYGNKKWGYVVTFWRNYLGETVKDKAETISEEQEAVDVILDFLNSCAITTNLEDAVGRGMAYYDSNGGLWVFNNQLRNLLTRHSSRISLRRLSYLLSDFLLQGSSKKRVGQSTKRFWFFNADMFNVEKRVAVRDSGDEGRLDV